MSTKKTLTTVVAATALTVGSFSTAHAVESEEQPPAQQSQIAQAADVPSVEEPGVEVPAEPVPPVEEPGVEVPAEPVPPVEEPDVEAPAPTPAAPAAPAPAASAAPAAPAPAVSAPVTPAAPADGSIPALVNNSAVSVPVGSVAMAPGESSHSLEDASPVPQQEAVASTAQTGPTAPLLSAEGSRHINSGTAGPIGSDPLMWVTAGLFATGMGLLTRAGLMKRAQPRHRAKTN